MLNNHSTFIQNAYKFLVISLLLISCSTNREVKPSKKEVLSNDTCGDNSNLSGDKRFLTISARHHAKVLSRCFQNFMRFETNKKQTIKTCNLLTVQRSGRVSYAYTRGYKGTIIPKDLRMCMEQDFWKMQFKGLQLKKGYTIRFPVSFQSK